MAFSLIVIMLQTNSSLCFSLLPYNVGVKRVESIIQVVLNIQTIIMEVNKYTCVKEILNINWWAFTLLHI